MEDWTANLGGELQGNCWCLLERQLHFRDVKVIFLALVTWMGGDREGEGKGDGEGGGVAGGARGRTLSWAFLVLCPVFHKEASAGGP